MQEPPRTVCLCCSSCSVAETINRPTLFIACQPLNPTAVHSGPRPRDSQRGIALLLSFDDRREMTRGRLRATRFCADLLQDGAPQQRIWLVACARRRTDLR